jgi:tetratricopeptide (TPR) repeat protein/SAM-dependent methyltransferase
MTQGNDRTSAPPAGGHDSHAASAIARGLAHQRAGRLDAAAALYQGVLEQYPGQPDALHLLGMVALQRGDALAAERRVRDAIARRPDHAEYHHDLGDVLRARQDVEGALACYRRAAALDPGHPDACFALGVLLQQQERLDEAAAQYRSALARRPRFAPALANLGLVAQRQGRVDEARQCLHEAAGAGAHDPQILFNVANALQSMGAVEDAAHLYAAVIALQPRHADAHNNLGAMHQRLGRLPAALASYRLALERQPGHADAGCNVAGLLVAAGRREEAVAVLRSLLPRVPGSVRAWMTLGLVQQGGGELEEAGRCFERAAALAPGEAMPRLELGNVRAAQARYDDAIAAYRAALALDADMAVAAVNLGSALLARGDAIEALAWHRRALAHAPSAEAKAALAQTLCRAPLDASDADMHALVAQAMEEGWARPAALALPARALLRADVRFAAMLAQAAERRPATPGPLGPEDLDALARLAAEPLLRALLTAAPVADVALEHLLAAARHALLERAGHPQAAASGAQQDSMLALACLLARQCYINEYVFAASDDEHARVRDLRTGVEAALAGTGGVDAPRRMDPMAIAVLAAYRPLDGLPGADAVVARAWPAPLEPVLAQQLAAPARERALQAALPRLTPSGDTVSRRVQEQYEAHPYPRWVRAGAPGPGRTVAARLRQVLPRLAPGVADAIPAAARVLVAGCGTGQEAVETGLQWPEAQILAIDLSAASLAHAARQAEAHAVRNVTFAQADLLALPRLGRRFHVISSVGVLHHLHAPLDGLRALAACLQPEGVMQLGFYSERARAHVTAARAWVAAQGFAPTMEGLHAARAALMALPADHPAAPVTCALDFHTTSGCRDLLMHVQERSYRLPEIAALLAQAGLVVAGLAVDPAVGAAYDACNGKDDPARVDLARWDAFEADHPGTFRGMFVLWVQRG